MLNTLDAAALRHAIIAEPGVDLHRLVYADLLEESGEADHANFIRRQVAGEKVKIGVAQFREWFEPFWGMSVPLLLSHSKGKTLARPSFNVGNNPPSTIKLRVRRGFIEMVYCSQQQWLDCGRILATVNPLAFVSLVDMVPASDRPGDFYWPFVFEQQYPERRRPCLRVDLWRCLDGKLEDPEQVKCYDNLYDAKADLSAGCIRWGRLLEVPSADYQTVIDEVYKKRGVVRDTAWLREVLRQGSSS